MFSSTSESELSNDQGMTFFTPNQTSAQTEISSSESELSSDQGMTFFTPNQTPAQTEISSSESELSSDELYSDMIFIEPNQTTNQNDGQIIPTSDMQDKTSITTDKLELSNINLHKEAENILTLFAEEIEKLDFNKPDILTNVKQITDAYIQAKLTEKNSAVLGLMIDSALIIADKLANSYKTKHLELACTYYILACYYNRYETFFWLEKQNSPLEKLLNALAKLLAIPDLDNNKITLEKILKSGRFTKKIIQTVTDNLAKLTLEPFDESPFIKNCKPISYNLIGLYRLWSDKIIENDEAYVHQGLAKLFGGNPSKYPLKELPNKITHFCILLCIKPFKDKLIYFISLNSYLFQKPVAPLTKKRSAEDDLFREPRKYTPKSFLTLSLNDSIFKPAPKMMPPTTCPEEDLADNLHKL